MSYYAAVSPEHLRTDICYRLGDQTIQIVRVDRQEVEYRLVATGEVRQETSPLITRLSWSGGTNRATAAESCCPDCGFALFDHQEGGCPSPGRDGQA